MESSSKSKQTALATAALASFMAPFMISSINLALPAIQNEFQLDAILLSWIATSFLLSTSIFLIPAGKIADIYGRKKMFGTGMLIFTIASLLCGISPNVWFLIGSRVIQGIGSAMMVTTGVAILMSVFPPNERGKVLGITVAAVYSGLSLGPFGGGMMIHFLGWRSIFYIAFPLGLFTIFFTN